MSGMATQALSANATPAMGDRALCRDSFAYCRDIARTQAKNFYYGMKLTPEPKRSALYSIYAWNRAVDDLADGITPHVGRSDDAQLKTDQLETFRKHTRKALDPNMPLEVDHYSRLARMWPAVATTFRTYGIPGSYLDAMIDGQVLDQTQTRYDTFEQLYDYCYKVASVVGLTCIEIWGYEGDAETRKLAEYRGIGLQLTNILRDIQEDAQRDRVYIPESILDRHGYDVKSFLEQLRRRQPDHRFERLVLALTQRARSYYQRSAALEQRLDPTCRSACWVIMYIYRRLLEQMANRPADVLTRRVRLSHWQKAWIAARAAWRHHTPKG